MAKHVSSEEDKKALEDFFAKGGKVQQIAPNVSGRVEGSKFGAWGAPRRKAGRPANTTISTEPTETEV
jgi:hypothetical protein